MYELQDNGIHWTALVGSVLRLMFSHQRLSDRTIDTVLFDEYPRFIVDQIYTMLRRGPTPLRIEPTDSTVAASEDDENWDSDSEDSSESDTTVAEDVNSLINEMPLAELFFTGMRRVEKLEADLGYSQARLTTLMEENMALKSHAKLHKEMDSLKTANRQLRRSGATPVEKRGEIPGRCMSSGGRDGAAEGWVGGR